MTETIHGPGPSADEADHHHTAKHRRDGQDFDFSNVEREFEQVDKVLLEATGDETIVAAQELLRAAKAGDDPLAKIEARDALIGLLGEHQLAAAREAIEQLKSDDYLLHMPGNDDVRAAQADFSEAKLGGDATTIDAAREAVYRAIQVQVEAEANVEPVAPAPIPEVPPTDMDGKYGFSKRDALYRHPAQFGNPNTEWQKKYNKAYHQARHALAESHDANVDGQATQTDDEQHRAEIEARTAEARVRGKQQYDAIVAPVDAEVHEVHHDDPGISTQGELQETSPEQHRPAPKPVPPSERYPQTITTGSQRQRFNDIDNVADFAPPYRHDVSVRSEAEWKQVANGVRDGTYGRRPASTEASHTDTTRGAEAVPPVPAPRLPPEAAEAPATPGFTGAGLPLRGQPSTMAEQGARTRGVDTERTDLLTSAGPAKLVQPASPEPAAPQPFISQAQVGPEDADHGTPEQPRQTWYDRLSARWRRTRRPQ